MYKAGKSQGMWTNVTLSMVLVRSRCCDVDIACSEGQGRQQPQPPTFSNNDASWLGTRDIWIIVGDGTGLGGTGEVLWGGEWSCGIIKTSTANPKLNTVTQKVPDKKTTELKNPCTVPPYTSMHNSLVTVIDSETSKKATIKMVPKEENEPELTQ
jgi:hypothetical protein